MDSDSGTLISSTELMFVNILKQFKWVLGFYEPGASAYFWNAPLLRRYPAHSRYPVYIVRRWVLVCSGPTYQQQDFISTENYS
jgi:hypothetical protein